MAIVATILALIVILVALSRGGTDQNSTNQVTSTETRKDTSSTPAKNNDAVTQQVQTPQTDVEQTVTVE